MIEFSQSQMPTTQEVRDRVNRALLRLQTTDGELFSDGVNERALTFRLGLYLQQEFDDWTVDCEYNRYRQVPKQLRQLKGKTINRTKKSGRVSPDIIIHRRGQNGPNLLVIEAKTSKTKRDHGWDYAKLYCYKSELGYCHTAFVVFVVESDPPEYEITFDLPPDELEQYGLSGGR